MKYGLQVLGQTDDTPEVPVYTPPDAITASQQAQANAEGEAAKARLRTVGGIALLGVVVLGAGALLFLTREPGSVRYRRALKSGQKRCIGHIKYAVMAQGRLKRVGKC